MSSYRVLKLKTESSWKFSSWPSSRVKLELKQLILVDSSRVTKSICSTPRPGAAQIAEFSSSKRRIQKFFSHFPICELQSTLWLFVGTVLGSRSALNSSCLFTFYFYVEKTKVPCRDNKRFHGFLRSYKNNSIYYNYWRDEEQFCYSFFVVKIEYNKV